MIVSSGFDLDKIVNACQADANQGVGKDGGAKRSAFKGGVSYKADGTLSVKDVQFSENQKIEYVLKANVCNETVKWNDSLEAHFKKCGQPTGPLTTALIPINVLAWFTQKFVVNAVDSETETETETKTEVPAKPAKRGVKPVSNGHAEPATV